jgi:ferritin-like metal-binding protein YciE
MKRQAKKSGDGNAHGDMHVSMLTDFFNDQLKDIYWAEKHLVKTLPKMKKAASSDDLALSFDDHLAESKQHIVRLEKIFELLGQKPETKKCDGMEGLVKEAEIIIEETREGTATRDVGLIFASQKIEHYEIATYGCLHQLALTLELNEIAELLESTLNEEKEEDKALTSIAKVHVNYDAMEEA